MAHAPSHRPRGVHQKPCRLSVSFHRPELAARLIDACLHELLRLLRPYGGLYALKPLKPWQHGPQHSLVQHLSRGGLPRRFGPLALELRLRGLPLRSSHICRRSLAKGVLHPHIAIGPLQLLQATVTKNVRFPRRRANIAQQPTALPPVANPLSPPTRALMLCLPLRHACHATIVSSHGT